ncbi:MAG TPA: MMPL family transporter [Nitriliruptorales bacterium]|nr:MMPL family transporter [Nitriliruptorales bacterium]
MGARWWLYRFRWALVSLTLVGAAAAGVVGRGVAESLSSGGFEDPDAESSRAAALVAEEFGGGAPDLVLVVTAGAGSVDDPDAGAAASALQGRLAAEEGVVDVASYWSLGGAPPLRSADGSRALVFARLAGSQDQVLERAGELRAEYHGEAGAITVGVGGEAAVFHEVNQVVEEDLVTAERIAFPVTLVLLVLLFGSVVAALLPLVIGGLAILGTFATLQIIANLTEVSIFALIFTTAMGLGLAIDYALLVVSRFREELHAGHEVPSAVRRTVRTAGRTVVFSAGTVAAALSALLAFEQAFLRSFAYAGIAVVGLAAAGAVVVLPAVLAIVGRNVNRWAVRRTRPAADGEGVWGRIAVAVMRRPIPIATVATVLLVLLGVPFLRVELGFPDERVLPAEASTRQVGEILRTEFGSAESSSTTVVAPALADLTSRTGDVASYAAALSRLSGVGRVDALTGSYAGGQQVVPPGPFSQRFASDDATYLTVVASIEPISLAGEQLVADIRALDAPFEVLVGGPSAELVDGKSGLLDRLPLALGLIAAITFVVLFMSFGSILVPLKAIVLNMLSLTATFGALVWVFQEGNLSELLGFTATGTLVMTMPVLMFIVAFGLSMDYEVFLLSRIKEEYDRTGDNITSVANGLERTGRIVTAAAVLISVVFAAFSTGRVSFMIMFGLGMMLAVLVDAFVIRVALVPAFMRLAGQANWWAPGPLRRFHDRFGFQEHVDHDEGTPGSEKVRVRVPS